MTKGDFFSKLGFLSLTLGLMLFGLHQFPAFQPHYLLSWVSCIFFVVFSILIYAIGYKAANHEDKHLFTSVILGFVFGKMFLSILMLVIYHKIVQPTDNLFLAPFFIVYLVYTVFETYFMIKLGKIRPDSKKVIEE